MGLDAGEYGDILGVWTRRDPFFQLGSQESLCGRGGLKRHYRCGVRRVVVGGPRSKAQPQQRRSGGEPAGAASAAMLRRTWVLPADAAQPPLAPRSPSFPHSQEPPIGSPEPHALPTGPASASRLPAAASSGLPNPRSVQRGADVIQLARKHRLEKTHTVNLTGN